MRPTNIFLEPIKERTTMNKVIWTTYGIILGGVIIGGFGCPFVGVKLAVWGGVIIGGLIGYKVGAESKD
jgi:hypothetical protein